MIDWKCKYCVNTYYINTLGEAGNSICPHCQRRQISQVSIVDDIREGRWDPRNGIIYSLLWKNDVGKAVLAGGFMYVVAIFVRVWLEPKIGKMSSQFSALLFDACLLLILLDWLKRGIQKRKFGIIILAIILYAFWSLGGNGPWWGVKIFWQGIHLFVNSVKH